MTSRWGYPDGNDSRGRMVFPPRAKPERKPSSPREIFHQGIPTGMSYLFYYYRTNLNLVKYQWKQQFADPINNHKSNDCSITASRSIPSYRVKTPNWEHAHLKYLLNKVESLPAGTYHSLPLVILCSSSFHSVESTLIKNSMLRYVGLYIYIYILYIYINIIYIYIYIIYMYIYIYIYSILYIYIYIYIYIVYIYI